MILAGGFAGGPTLEILWEPRDAWIGLYWKRFAHAPERVRWDFYLCVLPCLPIHLQFWASPIGEKTK